MDETNVDDLALMYLTGVRGEGRPTDSGPIDGLLREWKKIENTPDGRELGDAIVRRLSDSDPELRLRALQFLNAIPVCSLTEAVLPLVRGSRALFKGIYVDSGDMDLEFWLMWVLAKLVDINKEAHELAKNEALRPDGQPGPIAGVLAQADRHWVNIHRAEIEQLHPETKPAFDNFLK